MTLVITDSGLGGLSVLAHLLRILGPVKSSSDPTSAKQIIYVNAAPKDGQGYNDMLSRSERVRVFDRVLRNIDNLYNPDSIFVACGSLSGYLKELMFTLENSVPVHGINAVGNQILQTALLQHPHSPAFVFASPTTIAEGTYKRPFDEDKSIFCRIVAQSCPGLASIISSDRKGVRVKAAVRGFAQLAFHQWVERKVGELRGRPLLFLGCTHYSFQAGIFAEMLHEVTGQAPLVLDPNPSAARELAESAFQYTGEWHPAKVNFVTPYELPQEEIRTLTYFLQNMSPVASKAFEKGTVVPELVD